MKKILCIFMILLLIYPICPKNVLADGYISEKLNADINGNIKLTTEDKVATTDTTYRTIGWTITSDTNAAKSFVLVLPQTDEAMNSDGTLNTTFITDNSILYNRIGEYDKDWQTELYSKGGALIFDGILTVLEKGVPQGSIAISDFTKNGSTSDMGYSKLGYVYTTLYGIENARAWQQPSGLYTHFNKKLEIKGIFGESIKKHFTRDGTALSQYDSDEKLKIGEHYSNPARNIIGHKYIGYKVGYDNAPTVVPTNSLNTANGISFTYDAKYINVYIYYYYDVMPPNIIAKKSLDPVLSGVIKADTRGSEKFDVSKGIPSSENLYVNVFGKNYLHDSSFSEKTGVKRYQVTVSKTYNLTWLEAAGKNSWVTRSESQTLQNPYPVVREFSYWLIDNLDVFGLDKALVNNYALPGESVTMVPKNYTLPVLDTLHSDLENQHIKEPVILPVTLPSQQLNGGIGGKPRIPDEDALFRSSAENSVEQIKVKNDRLKFNDTLVMSDAQVPRDSQNPGAIPQNQIIGNDVFYTNALTIVKDKENRVNPSDGAVYYKRVNGTVNATGNADLERIIDGINSVTIHTPVVCNPSIWNDIDYNQMLKPDKTVASLILNRPSQLKFPTNGQHLDILGYGNKDYAKYVKDKQVKFPFDVYINSKFREDGKYLKANTWFSFPVDQNTIDFYLPIWVNEGNYNVEHREIAINDKDLTKAENLANLDINNYVATKTIPVQVIGRLFGFKVTDISDYPLWQKVFRTGDNTANHSENYYWVGTKDENGKDKGTSPQLTMPILEGSHTEIKNVGAIKTGYKFKYELETIGQYYNDFDCVSIVPKFYFVDTKGGNRKPVDLYYSEGFNDKENYFIKIDGTASGNRLNTKFMKLGDVYRNVPDEEIANTSRILGITENTFKNQDSKLGWFDWTVLSKNLRTYIGDSNNLPAGVNVDKVKKSQQKWYGEYYLPNDVYVAPVGFNVADYGKANNGLDGSEDFWLKNGYIIVNFDIETIKNQDFSNPVLSYWNSPSSNMWTIEGYSNKKTDSNGQNFVLSDGDAIFYYTDKKASDDYKSGGTH